MALDMQERLLRFLASAPQNDRSIIVLEVSHSAFSKTWRLWREPYAGQVTLETGAVVAVECINFAIKLAGSEGNLDQSYEISLDTTDVQDTFRAEMARVPIGTAERVRVTYREYLASYLAAPSAGPVPLQLEAVPYIRGTATLKAVSPRLNATRTGEIYAPRNIPMLRGFK